ncbi:MAG: ABC transporter ATP-binding protein [Candidatus Methanoplasma sp.]|jgi:iron complex transport system ATP-binding protein|nr:ABC transporter ATP-binding protein [Candidatus Methanoplasma sp.]
MRMDVEEVSVSIRGRRIVEAATLRAAEGELVGLIGPNGCGKSTLLKSVYRVLKRDSGEILIDCAPIDGMSLRESALRVSAVTQSEACSFDFRVEDAVMMGRAPHKRPMEMNRAEDRRIALDSLAEVGMLEHRDRLVSSLSGGERQRVILARALAQQTPCLILDEPTNHLDIRYQLETLAIVRRLGRTALCALHDLNLAAQHCDRIYVMADGRIVREGAPEEVVTEEMILEVYGVRASVGRHPETGALNVAYHPVARPRAPIFRPGGIIY